MDKIITTPEIRIQYSRLLDPFFESLFDYEQEKGLIAKSRIYNTPETIIQKIGEFKNAWQKRKQVLLFMQETLELNFYQTIIDAYVVGFIKHCISTPIIINSTKLPINFADTLTHELLHRLISDNQEKIKARDILLKLFPDETLLCRNHVVVHAVLKKIYLEFLNAPDRLHANKELDKNSPDYTRAWEIVDALGENTVVKKFKELYGK